MPYTCVASGRHPGSSSLIALAILLALGGCASDDADPSDEAVASAAHAATVTAIPRGSVWRAWDRGGDLGSAWRASYDDSTWKSGPGPLGYGETYIATPLGFGPSSTNRYITTYFRRSFTVTNPASVTALLGDVMYDDGFVVYLNGTRIGRDAMPSGTITASTLALGHEAGNAYQRYDWTAQKGLLVAGTNVIAVEVHQSSASSSDLVFDLSLLVETSGAPTPLPRNVGGQARRDYWRYWDQGGDLGTAWRVGTYSDRSYDDNAWPTGFGPFGYGETYVNKTIGYGSDATRRHITTYFRAQLWVGDTAQVQSMIGELMYDDGLVVYLNGTEIARRSMPAGTVTASTLALGHEAENRYETLDWNAHRGLLRQGYNILAVEVHQSSPSSSDLVFDLALLLTSVGPNPPADAPEDIARGSTWRFYDRGAAPDSYTSWRYPTDYSDAHWGSGPAPLGYGESYIATPVSYGPDPANRYVTTYFRRWFNVANPSSHTTMIADLMYDDGLIVYINGREITRLHMPPVWQSDYELLAQPHETGTVYERHDWSASNSALVPGPNLIVVEVHQSSRSSSNLSFDLGLQIDTPAVPGIPGCGEAVAPPPSASLSGVWVGPETVWVVGGASIGRRALAGGPWQWCKRPAGTALYSIWGSGEDDVWMVGADGQVLRYDGSAFAQVDVGTTVSLGGIWGSGPDRIFVVGSEGTVRVFDGTSWWADDLGPAQHLRSVWGTGPEDVWVGGAEPAPYPGNSNYDGWTAIVYRRQDGSWNRVADYTMYYGGADFSGLHGTSANDLWAVGSYHPAGAAASYSQAVHSDGSTWTQNPGMSEDIYGDHSFTDVLALGSEVWIAGYGTMTHYDGAAWSEEPDVARNMADIDGRAGEIWAVGAQNRIVHRTAAGWVRDW